jgi:hypothetical protein
MATDYAGQEILRQNEVFRPKVERPDGAPIAVPPLSSKAPTRSRASHAARYLRRQPKSGSVVFPGKLQNVELFLSRP